MKKLILAVLTLAGISFGISAQQHKNYRQSHPAERAAKMSERMAEELKLTDEQRKLVSQLTLENANRQEELHKRRKAELEAQKEYRLAQEQKLAAILTDEQKQIWEQRKEALRNRGKHQSHGDQGQGGRPRARRGH